MSKREKKKKLEPKTDEAKPEVEEKPEKVEPTEEEKPEEEEKPVEVKKEVKEEKPKKKKEKKARLSTLYDYDYEKNIIKLKNKKCPRCGNIMALHKSPIQRWTCGSCSYTEYVKKEENESLSSL